MDQQHKDKGENLDILTTKILTEYVEDLISSVDMYRSIHMNAPLRG